MTSILRRPARRFLIPATFVALLLGSTIAPAASVAATIPTFVPIGAGYTAETLEQFAADGSRRYVG